MKILLFFVTTFIIQISFVFSQVASDYCGTATHICTFNNYHGIVHSGYTNFYSESDSTIENNLPLGSIFCGSIEINSWLKFDAIDTLITVDVSTFNCSSGDGVQMEIYSTEDCLNFTPVSGCISAGNNFQLTASPLIPGETYYIMIDGFAGNYCEYFINAIAGMPLIDAGEDITICKNDSVMLHASSGYLYSWIPDTFINSTAISNPIVFPQDTINYIVEISFLDSSCPPQTDTVTVNVELCCESVAGISDSVCGLFYNELSGNYQTDFIYSSWLSPNSEVFFTNPSDYNTNVFVDSSGTYPLIWEITTQDTATCSDTIYITFFDSINIEVLTIDETEFGFCDGQAEAIITGGLQPYDLTWIPGDFSTPVITDLCSGNYLLIVNDSANCSSYFEFIISFGDLIKEKYSDLQIYPSMFNENCFVLNETQNAILLNIYNINGNKVMSYLAKTGESIINFRYLSQGTYFIKWLINGLSYTKKVTLIQ